MNNFVQLISMLKSNKLNNQDNLIGLNSRKYWLPRSNPNNTLINTKRLEIFKLLNYHKVFTNCFFSSEAYLDLFENGTTLKQFNNSIIEVPHINSNILEFLKNNKFQGCQIYIHKLTLKIAQMTRFYETIDNLEKTNIIISSHYLKSLSHNNSLADVSLDSINGLSMYKLNTFTSDIPNDFKFFTNACRGTVNYCSFPPLNFTNFKNIDSGGVTFNHCSFSENTIFPKDNLFFIKNSFINCEFPEYNFQNYLIPSTMILNCSFNINSTLPDNFLSKENINLIQRMRIIPKKYLSFCSQFADIENVSQFISANEKYLSEEDKYLIYKRNI